MTDPLRNQPSDCPDRPDTGERDLNRRDFAKRVGGIALAGGLLPNLGGQALAAEDKVRSSKRPAETAARRLYESLNDQQRKLLCLPFDHELRTRISPNWAITKPHIRDLKADQQALVREIVQGVTSPDGFERLLVQMDEDAGGLEMYHIALFGEPGTGQFEFEMTGRHLTLRADGDSTEGTAFGGPIVYGHGTGDSEKGMPGNVFYYQTLKANEVFEALDGKQRDKALAKKAPPETAVDLQGSAGQFPGISVSELSPDQQELVEQVIKVILAPYREDDVEEAVAIMKSGGGLDALHMAFYEANDIGDDQIWDIWRLEGPTFVWHFRGAPHVHAYVNISKKI